MLCKNIDNFVNTINVPTENARSEKICTFDRVDAEIRRATNECVVYNADRDKLKVKHARVPSGAETCQFCIMLASRGAV